MNNNPVRSAFLTCCVLLPLTAVAQHSDHSAHGGHAGMSAEQIGSDNIHFDNSCNPAVTEAFNRGVALMHSFWFAEAINTFNRVLDVDPDCPMAHWGIALSHWGNPFAGQRNPQQIQRGQVAVERARSTGSPDLRERAYINAVAELFTDDQGGTQRARTLAYEQAMEQLVQAWPEDDEAKIFHALAINQNAPSTDQSFANQIKAAEILEPLFEANPDHPGIAHYIIHAYDHPPLADRALEAARRYAALAPDAPHALHMPSHTFTRVGMWQDSVESNLRSAEVARNNTTAGEELHALDYKTYAYLQMAQDEMAHGVVERAGSLVDQVDITAVGATQAGAFAIAAIPARYALERGDFAAAAQLTVHPADTPHAQAMTHFARAVGAARSGNPSAADDDIAMLLMLRDRSEQRQDAYWTEQIDIQILGARAWVAFAEGDPSYGVALMTEAADREDRTEKSAVTPGPLAPAREMLGVLLMEIGEYEHALTAFESTLTREPNRFLTLLGAARAADAMGNTGAARDHYRQLLQVAATADTDRLALQEARRYLD